MSLTGPVEGPPSRVGIPIIDITSGMFASTAILSALRARDLTGEGQLIDISLFDAHIALLTNAASNYLIGEQPPRRLGNAHPNIAPYEIFPVNDGWIMVGAANDRQWATLCNILNRTDLLNDARFEGNSKRVAHRVELLAELNQTFSQRNAREWLDALMQAGLPCAPINNLPQVFADPQTEARNMILETQHPTAGAIRMTGFPYKLSATPAEVHAPPPTLGQHTDEILAQLRYSDEEIAALHQKNAV